MCLLSFIFLIIGHLISFDMVMMGLSLYFIILELNYLHITQLSVILRKNAIANFGLRRRCDSLQVFPCLVIHIFNASMWMLNFILVVPLVAIYNRSLYSCPFHFLMKFCNICLAQNL